MEDDPYKGWNSISSIIGHPKTAFFHTIALGDESMEYKTCCVRYFSAHKITARKITCTLYFVLHI